MEELAITTEVTQYIKIRIQDEYFGIDIKYVDNIVRMQHITRVPMAPDYIKGVIKWENMVALDDVASQMLLHFFHLIPSFDCLARAFNCILI